MSRQPGFETHFRQSRIDIEVLIEEEVTNHGDAALAEASQQFGKPG